MKLLICRTAAMLVVFCGADMAFAATPRTAVWWGTVSYVVDGDTIRVRPLSGGKPISLRLEGIDAPEICQPGGEASREALKRRVLGQKVAIHGRARDTYGRMLAPVDLEGQDLGEWMVEKGQAWSYRYRGDIGPYAVQERRARAAGLGLFSRGNGLSPMEPRQFRKEHGTCYPLRDRTDRAR